MDYNTPGKRRRMTRSTTQDTTAVIIKEKDEIIPKPEELKADTLNSHCWTTILSYLPLADVIMLAQCQSSFAKIVDQFISSGNEITIDDVFVHRFPIQRNQNQYRHLGEITKSLMVTGLTQVQANFLLPFFKDITKLTLDKMEIAEGDISAFPTGIQSLKIAHSSISKGFFCAWLAKASLESVNLNDLRLTPRPQNRYQWEYRNSVKSVLKTVRYLTLERIDMTLGSFLEDLCELESLTMIQIYYPYSYSHQLCLPRKADKLRFLTVVAPHLGLYYRCLSPAGNLSALEHLSVSGKEPDQVWKCLESKDFTLDLKTFECYDPPISIKEILKWKGLEHVKIHCNWYHAESLRKTFSRAKSCVVTCSLPTPGCNFVDVLNDDCLQLILAYLEDKDIYKLAIVHPRFLTLRPRIRIDQDCFKLYPLATCGRFYDTVAMSTTELEVGKLKQKDLFKVLSHFKRLSRLIVHEQRLSDLNGVASFPMVEELQLYLSVSLSHEFWGALFGRLNPELKSLLLGGAVQKLWRLTELTNIERLVIDIRSLERSFRSFSKFFKQNPKLSYLDIHSPTNCTVRESLLTVLGNINAPALRTLLYRNHIMESYSAGFAKLINGFLNLEWLSIDLCALSKLEIEKFVVLKHLTKLSIDRVRDINDKEKILIILGKLPTLKVFEVIAIPEVLSLDVAGQLKVFAEAKGNPFSYWKHGEYHTFKFTDAQDFA